ncbi:MAG: hypothetical protein R3301_06235, partial [Saprospiraceae bacterium]|nr:hypothetical protein [Saprospiraceae bacterium]
MQQLATSCILVFLLSALLFCKTSDTPPDPNYITSIEAWRTARLDALKRPRGWASLVGLHWLPEGQQSFGASDTADIQLPESSPEVIGVWHRAGDTVRFRPTPGLAVWSVNESTPFSGGEVRADSDAQPHLLNHQSLYWMVIQRGDQYGVRVWDTLHHARSELTEIPHFPVDPAWALPAQFEPAPPGTQMMVDNAVGLTVPVNVAGTVYSAQG